MPKRESVRRDRLLPVFASAFNGSVSVEGSRNGPDVRSVREGEVLCRFRKDFAPGMRCRRFACERAIVFEREGEEDVADVSICQNLRKERKKQDLEIALLRGPVFSVPIAGAIGCSLSRIPGRFVFGLDFKVKIREDSLVIGDIHSIAIPSVSRLRSDQPIMPSCMRNNRILCPRIIAILRSIASSQPISGLSDTMYSAIAYDSPLMMPGTMSSNVQRNV